MCSKIMNVEREYDQKAWNDLLLRGSVSRYCRRAPAREIERVTSCLFWKYLLWASSELSLARALSQGSTSTILGLQIIQVSPLWLASSQSFGSLWCGSGCGTVALRSHTLWLQIQDISPGLSGCGCHMALWECYLRFCDAVVNRTKSHGRSWTVPNSRAVFSWFVAFKKGLWKMVANRIFSGDNVRFLFSLVL